MTKSTNLAEVIQHAESLIRAGDYEEADRFLGSATPSMLDSAQVSDLMRFAKLCHEWGPAENEEAALRSALRHGPDLEATMRLLDLMQQERLDDPGRGSRERALKECIQLGTDALKWLDERSGLEWGTLTHTRGVRYLELAQLGNATAREGRRDVCAYLSWLKESPTVPPHLNRPFVISTASLDLAELMLIEGEATEAATLLEEAISQLEALHASKWDLDRGYALLDRALGGLAEPSS